MFQKTEVIPFNERAPMRLYCYRLTELPAMLQTETELLFILSGACTVVGPDFAPELNEDDILLINPDTVYEIRAREACTLISLSVDTTKLNMPEGPVRYTCCSAKDPDKTKYVPLKRLLAQLVKKNSTVTPENSYFNLSVLYSMLFELRMHFNAEESGRHAGKYAERMNGILEYIDAHYREGLTFNQLAETFHFSVPYLSSFFKRYLGVNFQTYYTNLRLERSVNDLLHTDLPIEQIALSNGFPNARAFVTSFRDEYGTLPSLYRKSAQDAERKTEDGERFDEELGQKSYMSILAKYLPEQIPSSPTEIAEGRSDLKIVRADDIRASSAGTPLKHAFRKFTSVGRAKELLFADVQSMLTELQAEVGFEFIKFHGLLADDMLVYAEDSAGSPRYSFVYIDKAFDFLLSIGLKPLVQFSYMPKQLALHPERTAYASPYVISMPKSMKKWTDLITALTEHLIERYGRDRVRGWLFCCWNEPDTSVHLFGFERDEDFYELYRETYLAVKKVDPALVFGSPSLLISYNINQEWCGRYIAWCGRNGCMPAFMNIHYYENDFSDNSFEGHRPAHPRHSRLNRDEDSFAKCIRKTKNLFDEWGIGKLPVYITEWNLTVSHRNLLNDTCFKSCYLAKNLLENYDEFDSFGYWVLTDMIEETIPSREQFHGGLGLYTTGGIRKPHYYVFRFLSRLGDRLIGRGRGYFVTKSPGKITAIVYNYEHFNHLFAEGETFDMDFKERYTPFNKLGGMDFSMTLRDLPLGQCVIRESMVNQTCGSAFDEWIRMGAQPLSADDVKYLRSVSVPGVHVRTEEITDGTLTLEAALDPLEMRLIEISLAE